MGIGDGDVGSRRRWCTEIGEAASPTITAALSANPHGGGFRQANHAVQHHDGDGGLALLRLHGASAQPRSDQGLIAAYCGLGEAASPVAVVALPCHAATLGNVANTPVAHRTGLPFTLPVLPLGATPAVRRADRTVTGWTASGSYEVTSRPIAGRRPAGRYVNAMTRGQSR